MHIGVLSDTHGNAALLHEAAGRLAQAGAGKFYHLGDNYEDAADLDAYGHPVLRVPGVFHPRYRSGDLAPVAWDEAAGRRLALVHAAFDLGEADIARADVILFGHTHDYAATQEDGTVFLNPGHLKDRTHKDRPATFGLLNITEDALRFTVLNLAGEPVLEKSFD